MQRTPVQRFAVQLLAAAGIAALVALVVATSAFAQEIGRERFEVDFAGFASQIELTYPAGQEGPFPAVVLIPGSGVADMDHSVFSSFGFGPGQEVLLSANFRTLAEELSARGFAVVRYNKRHVTGPNQADFSRLFQLSLADFLADAAAVVEAAIAHPKVDRERLYLYGWSEGSTLAATLAAQRGDIAGLILQTPVVFPWKETFVYQVFEVGWPFLMSVAEEGYITPGALGRAMASDAGLVAKSVTSYVVDPMAMYAGRLAVNSALDADGDGRLKIGVELTLSSLLGVVEAAFEPGGYFAMYSPERALPPVGDRIGALDLPILILQGERDANVPARSVQLLYDSLVSIGHPDVTLHLYPALGHSLGETVSVRHDNFQPIAAHPIEDLVNWLSERAADRR